MVDVDAKPERIRPFGGMRFVVGVVFAGLSAMVNGTVFLGGVVFSHTTAEAVWFGSVALAIDWIVIPLVAVWAARGYESKTRNALLAACVGSAVGPIPFVIWIVVGLLATGS